MFTFFCFFASRYISHSFTTDTKIPHISYRFKICCVCVGHMVDVVYRFDGSIEQIRQLVIIVLIVSGHVSSSIKLIILFCIERFVVKPHKLSVHLTALTPSIPHKLQS